VLAVDVAELHRLGAELARARAVLGSTLDDLDADVRQLSGTWDGAAHRAYAERRAVWRRAAGELAAALGEIGRAVDDSAADYLTVERGNRELFA
jgi:6 kDa early secretory antigenic target